MLGTIISMSVDVNITALVILTVIFKIMNFNH